MNEELRLLQEEVALLKEGLDNLRTTVLTIIKMQNVPEDTNSNIASETKIKWTAEREYSEDYIAKWQEYMTDLLKEQGNSEEEIASLLGKIIARVKSSKYPEDSSEDAELKTLVSEELRKNLEKKGTNIGVLVSTLGIKGENNYSVWGVLDNKKQFLNFDPLKMAQFYNIFANEQRLVLLRTLIENGELTASELQEKTGIAAGGQFYHHLKEIAAADLLAKTKRGSYALSSAGKLLVATVFAVGISNATENADITKLVNMLEGLTNVAKEEISE